MEGEKKYSPPLGTTQVGRGREVLWLAGLVPTIERAPGPLEPMMGSNPGFGTPGLWKNSGSFAHAGMISIKPHECCSQGSRTLLNKLEALLYVTLVRSKQQASALSCLATGCLSCRNFWSKLNAAAYDTIVGDWAQFLQVGSWVSLTSMRGERASVLGQLVVGKVIAEVVIARVVVRYGWVIVGGCKIHGCS